MPASTLVIVNPMSRSGATGRRFAPIEARLREALGPLEIERTRAPRDAERIAREAVRAGVERLVVAGGDGTLSEVATGLLAAGLAGYARIAPLALGTGGDLLRSFGVSRDVDKAIARIAAGKTRRIDAGRARFRGPDGRDATTFFVNVASVGVSGLVTRLVNDAPKALGGRVSFLIGTLRALARYRTPHVALKVDGAPFFEGPLTLATAANCRYFGGGMHVAPAASPDDGLLDVVVVSGLSKPALVARLPLLYRGTHLASPGVRHTRGRLVEADVVAGGDVPAGAVHTEIDGEPLGTLPASYEVIPGAITLLGVDE